MNYQKIYNNLINRAITRTGYVEKHHIMPRCLGGLNNKENFYLEMLEIENNKIPQEDIENKLEIIESFECLVELPDSRAILDLKVVSFTST